MKNIFMYLNIPWDFIKQRPQFLAENINKYLNITVYYNKPYKQSYITKNKISDDIHIISKIKIPRKNRILRSLDNKLQQILVKKYIENNEYIWIMHVEQYEILRDIIGGKSVIYDCMDDYSKFPNIDIKEQVRIEQLEKELINISEYVFYSSKTLKEVHEKRYGSINKSYIINNAFNNVFTYNEDLKIKHYLENIATKKIVYIGAISEWFDFDLVKSLIRSIDNLSVILFGPTDIDIPNIKGLYHFGKIEHDSIHTAMKYSDILIMPFKINELILSVDPIKIYEYIYSGKYIIAPNYPEMDKFKGFVHTYNSTNEAIELVRLLDNSNSKIDIQKFVESNTWEARAKQIAQIIQDV